MNTFILNPNDTVVISDSIIVKAMRISGTCQTGINEAATNWADVEIVRIISCTIITTAIIFVVGYILVKIIAAISACCSEKRKRDWDVEDRNKKRNAELLDRLLNFKEKQGAPYIVNEKEQRIDKDGKPQKVDKEAIKDYISLLENQLEIEYTQQNETENKANS